MRNLKYLSRLFGVRICPDFSKGQHKTPCRTNISTADIDYMNQYRDFDNDANRFDYSEGAKFLSRLHASHQHYVPIVDSAIYAPNPENASDAYPPYDRGMEANAFMLNPDGSVYYGEVWPGYTVFPDWIGAVLNGTGAIDWWTKEVALWHEKLDVWSPESFTFSLPYAPTLTWLMVPT